jgi:O-antigen ligase
LVVFGLTAFGIRFRGYFAAGATSVGARFDYWHAAVQTTRAHPVFGTGPGTFQHPYAEIKTPEAEMARLTHNDYLEQFSDSGLIGGLAYAAWIILLFGKLGRWIWKSRDLFVFAIFLGCFGWFVQGLSEFSLYVPALAWTAFLLAGRLLNISAQPIASRPQT